MTSSSILEITENGFFLFWFLFHGTVDNGWKSDKEGMKEEYRNFLE